VNYIRPPFADALPGHADAACDTRSATHTAVIASVANVTGAHVVMPVDANPASSRTADDDDVLRVADERPGGADVGGAGERERIRHRIEPTLFASADSAPTR
jgi:hypothetical protein